MRGTFPEAIIIRRTSTDSYHPKYDSTLHCRDPHIHQPGWQVTPDISLAFAVQSNPGVYAILLGSGVSRAASIPTGWEVVLDLVRKLAVVHGEDCEPDPASWYQAKYGEQPGYSKLLDALAKTPSERQQILRAYFEPTQEEQDEGIKAPTRAHRAIAKLVATGYIRVILTTNFDRLIERALEEEGIAPTVISNADQIQGAVPLAHIRCCVVKLHGDYLDTRILNTPEELATYDPRLNTYLDRVFDEFGLIACGWSAEWDEALRNAIDRTPNRRYSTFFAARGGLGERAATLVQRRGGAHLPIADADSFFESVQTKIEAIAEFSQPHPLSVKVAVTACKRFLGDPVAYRIRLSDLVGDEARRVAKELVRSPLSDTSEAISTVSVTARVRKYDALCESLSALAFQIGRWGDAASVRLLADVQRRLYATKGPQGLVVWLSYQAYPVSLITYAALLGAALEERIEVVGPLLTNEIETAHRNPVLAVDVVPPFCLLEENPTVWGRILEGKGDRRAPLNEWISDQLHLQFSDEFASSERFDLCFDWVEIMLAMANHALSPPKYNAAYYPPGCHGYRQRNRERVLQMISKSLDAYGEKSPYVAARLFGAAVQEVKESIAGFEGWIPLLRWY